MEPVVAKFLLGAAGCGKTFRCLTEIRAALATQAEGSPLVLLAPKQSTYQLERALLDPAGLAGYTRLRVLSFERLAQFAFERLEMPLPKLLSDQGRLMVLRSILTRRRNDLKLFRASARLTGFANQLALLLDELQRHEITPDQLEATAATIQDKALGLKLQDVATLYRDYTGWLDERHLKDANTLLTLASAALSRTPAAGQPLIEQLWADGFADLSVQESSFLASVARHTGDVTVTFCLPAADESNGSWLSNWAAPGKSLERCRRMFVEAGMAAPSVELIRTHAERHRFSASPALAHIERRWAAPAPFGRPDEASRHVRILACTDPEAEVREAAREIMRHVRAGGRFREVAVLARRLGSYAAFIKRIFAQFDIPCFIDRREDVSHHPFAELTRSALRTVVFDWRPEDWFSALKTGLVPATDEEIDHLENEALARGWRGEAWSGKLDIPGDDGAGWIADLSARILPPFHNLRAALAGRTKGLTGPEMAAALKSFWRELDIENRLEKWVESNKEGVLAGESHLTVWSQVNRWLDDVELAFAEERMSLREWMPVLDAGLSALTIGVIPPALDQALAGAMDRSRNCEARLVILLGLNETIFPGRQEQSALFTEADRETLSGLHVIHASTARDHISRERHLGYLAFTRASERLVATFSAHDSQGAVLNPSPFVSHLLSLFPGLEPVQAPAGYDWSQAEHACELILPALQSKAASREDALCSNTLPPELLALNPVSEVLGNVGILLPADGSSLGSETARKLYGPALKTSVSRMEQFAACPFKFFVNSGLDARERARFELDARERGSFQHEILAEFHNRLAAQKKRWRDITPARAREMIAGIASEKAEAYRDGLLQVSEQTRFTALLITEYLQDFVETMVAWMSQYQFDPVAAEMDFGGKGTCPGWDLDLGSGFKLSLHGRIDRVDIHACNDGTGAAYCVVTDYKSGQKKLDDVLIEHGLQLQLLSYLNVLARWTGAGKEFGTDKLVPAGVFYVSLRGDYKAQKNRSDVIAASLDAKKAAYRHAGRFDSACLPLLDNRNPASGDQFAFKINKNGEIAKTSKDPMSTADFAALLAKVESNLADMGRRIYAGEAGVSPYRKGSQTACRQCDYISVCRSDPWTQVFRVLKKEKEEA